MQLSDFDYALPAELIAQAPINPRDHSRLLILHRDDGRIEHKQFFDIKQYLKSGDVVVLNNTKVIPARLIGQKKTGGKVEVFLLKKNNNDSLWNCLVSGLKNQTEVFFDDGVVGRVEVVNGDGTYQVQFNIPDQKFARYINKYGTVPLPPYIKSVHDSDKARYQTVFADKEKNGSVAAPTAGLHFTKKLIAELKKMGVQFEQVTLHVGLGTFASVKTDNIKKHQMHSEYYEVTEETYERIAKAKHDGQRIIAVGTTATRTLETVFAEQKSNKAKEQVLQGETDIFIYPGYKFKAVDGIITNFHVPKSTLLMLVSAFAQNGAKDKKAGLKKIKRAYDEAIKNKYRFFSYGDAMMII